MSLPKYEDAFYVDANGVIQPTPNAVSANMAALPQVEANTDVANWDGSGIITLDANSFNTASNLDLPTAAAQAGFLKFCDSAGNVCYVPFWQ